MNFWHVVMVLNSFLMILSGLLRGLDDFLTVYWECLMNNCGPSLLRAEWSRTTKKLTSWLFGILLVQIRIVGQGPNCTVLKISVKIILKIPSVLHYSVRTRDKCPLDNASPYFIHREAGA